VRLHKNYPLAEFKALPDENGTTGRFSAIVSVFGNVDFQGDKVMDGAFTKSIQKWRDSGDPIPIIWSHDWGNPDAIIGFADPNDVEEVHAGQKDGEAGVGGLLVRGQLDIHKPFAAQVYDLLKRRIVKEFSFAYDVIKEKQGEDKANELHVLDLIEAGPTLKGANDQTELLGVKAGLESAAKRQENVQALSAALLADPELARSFLPPPEEKPAPPAPAKEDDPPVVSSPEETVVQVIDPDGIKAEVDDGEWDGNAAMQSCSSAADYAKIAFRRTGDSDPDTAAAWALPHHSSPGAPPNVRGVGSAIGALNGARGGEPGLADPGAARSHLEAHQSAIENASKEEKVAEAGSVTLKVHLDTSEVDEYVTGLKAGRVIGAKALSDLKSRIDAWAAEVNGTLADEEKASPIDEAVVTVAPDVAEFNAKLAAIAGEA